MIPTPEQWVSVRQQLRTLANLAHPLEACGFIFSNEEPRGTEADFYAVSVSNKAEWPYAQYRIADEDVEWALRSGRCIAVWHSHPEGPAVPSEIDAELAVPDIYQVIYAVEDEDLAIFLVEDGQLVPQTLVMPGAEPDALTIEVRP